jgi:hypothetical protein
MRCAPYATPNRRARHHDRLAPHRFRSAGEPGRIVHLPRLAASHSRHRGGRYGSRRCVSTIALVMAATLIAAVVALLTIAMLAST